MSLNTSYAGRFFTTSTTWEAQLQYNAIYMKADHCLRGIDVGNQAVNRELTKGCMETSESDGYIHYFDFGDGFIGVLTY